MVLTAYAPAMARIRTRITDRPFGVTVAQAFVRDPGMAEIVVAGYRT